jgi:hypothetical protein
MQPPAPRESEIEVQPLHRLARVPIHIDRRRAAVLLVSLVAIDLALTVAYLGATSPGLRAQVPVPVLAWLDPTLPANLPWTWQIVKLCGAAALCGLMAFAYPGEVRRPAFWVLGCIVLLALAVAESAGLHAIWARTAAPAVFGADAPALYEALSRGAPLALVYAAALAPFARLSRTALAILALSALAVVLGALGPPARLAAAQGVALSAEAVAAAWRGGLHTLAASLLVAAIAFAVRDIQAVAVRYVYRSGPSEGR